MDSAISVRDATDTRAGSQGHYPLSITPRVSRPMATEAAKLTAVALDGLQQELSTPEPLTICYNHSTYGLCDA